MFTGEMMGQSTGISFSHSKIGSLEPSSVANENDSSQLAGPKNPKLAQKLSNYPTIITSTLGTALFVILDRHPPSNALPEQEFGLKTVGTGLLLGPSIGHIYAEQWDDTIVGLGLRGAGIVISVIGYRRTMDCIEISYEKHTCTVGQGMLAALGTLGGGALVAGSAYHDMHSADQSAVEYNRETKRGAKVSVSPFFGPLSGSVGMTVNVGF
jgi:hypothetical protein